MMFAWSCRPRRRIRPRHHLQGWYDLDGDRRGPQRSRRVKRVRSLRRPTAAPRGGRPLPRRAPWPPQHRLCRPGAAAKTATARSPRPPRPLPIPIRRATAKCKDGTYSKSSTTAGTCSSHGGVADYGLDREARNNRAPLAALAAPSGTYGAGAALTTAKRVQQFGLPESLGEFRRLHELAIERCRSAKGHQGRFCRAPGRV